MTDSVKTQQTSKIIPLIDWPKHHAWPPIGGLRHLVFHADKNGFNKVVRRAGRRVLLDEWAFFQWLDEQNGINSGSGRDA